jgi:hypothetical protein
MAKFKCIANGGVHEFTIEHDIDGMRLHPEYEEVFEEETVVVEEKPKRKKSEPIGE